MSDAPLISDSDSFLVRFLFHTFPKTCSSFFALFLSSVSFTKIRNFYRFNGIAKLAHFN